MLLAEHQPTVRHALVALGAVHEDYSTFGRVNFSDYALQNYSLAIKGVANVWTLENPQTMEVALATCIIFASLESLRGCSHSCMSLIVSGTKILETRNSDVATNIHTVIPELQLRWLFVRMANQIMDIGGSQFDDFKYPYTSADLEIPPIFASPGLAMMSLETLYSHMTVLLKYVDRAAGQRLNYEPFLMDISHEMQSLKMLHHKWQRAFEHTKSTWASYPNASSRDPEILAIDMMNNVVTIVLDVNISDLECDYDRHQMTFDTIVEEAQEYISKTSTYDSQAHSKSRDKISTPSVNDPTGDIMKRAIAPKLLQSRVPTFSMSMGCVGALYFSAARCRKSATRYRALALLQNCYRREGLWDSELAATIVEKVIKLGENGAQSLPTAPAMQPFTSSVPATEATEIPRETRVKILDAVWVDEAGVEVICSKQYAGTARIDERHDRIEVEKLGNFVPSYTQTSLPNAVL